MITNHQSFTLAEAPAAAHAFANQFGSWSTAPTHTVQAFTTANAALRAEIARTAQPMENQGGPPRRSVQYFARHR
ncbi:hypothetical protein [Streptomyces sp. NPDC002758]